MSDNSTVIIAEAGVNHNGDIAVAKKMIDCAKDCGADIVKFQTGLPHNVISKYAPKADYQKRNTQNSDDNQLSMAEGIAFTYEVFDELKTYCDQIGIEFLSTPFDIGSIDYLHGIGVRKWKIPSGEITNLPYLEHIGLLREPVILSTGMADINEVEVALSILRRNGANDITLLHCTTDYPTSYDDVNLKAMLTMKERFKVNVGYSDHTLGIEIPVAAVSMGACIIEKHFTLSRNMPGPDHKASLEPDELKSMIISIRNVERALGNGEKKPVDAELSNISVARKSIVARKNIKKGEIFTPDNITTKRPGTGLSPMKWYEVIGTEAIRDFNEDELIEV